MLRKLLRSKILRFIVVVAFAVGLIAGSKYLESQLEDVKLYKEVYVATEKLSKDTLIKDEHLKTIEIGILDLPEDAVEDKSKLIGKYLSADLGKGDYVLTTNVNVSKHTERFTIPEKHKIVSLPLNIDSAVGWKFDLGQNIDLMYSATILSDDEESIKADYTINRLLEDVIVIDILNDLSMSIEDKEFTGVPKYVVLMAKESDAEFIAVSKNKGRFDILIKKNIQE